MERATYQRLPTCISSCKTAARTSRLFPATRRSLQTAFDIRRYAEDWLPACSPRCDQLENHVVRLAHKGCKRFLWSWWYRRLFLSVIPVLERSLRKPSGARPGQVKRLACRALPAIASLLLLPANAVSRIDSPSPEVLVLFPQADSKASSFPASVCLPQCTQRIL
jgi:hypothetical protein